MATRTIQIIDDDIDPTVEATGTIKFGVDSVWYEIDLSDAHQKEFHKAIKKFVDNGRRVGGKAGGVKAAPKAPGKAAKKTAAAPSESNGANTSGHSNAEIRDWARTNNVEVPTRGRIPAEVIASFMEAQNGAEPIAS